MIYKHFVHFLIIFNIIYCELLDKKYPILTEYLHYLENYLNKSDNTMFYNRSKNIDYFDVYTNSNEFYKQFQNITIKNSTKPREMLFKNKNENSKHVQKIPYRFEMKNFNKQILKNLKNLLQTLKTDNSSRNEISVNNTENEIETSDVKTKLAENRLLNLFTVINFDNDACYVDNAYGSFNGTCYHPAECQHLGGKSIGKCRHPYGVCCICTYFRFFIFVKLLIFQVFYLKDFLINSSR